MRHGSQSCGSATAATRAAFSGSASRSQRSLVAVSDATGTEPIASAHACAPASSADTTRSCASGTSSARRASPSSRIRSRAAGAERVSFHRSASRTTFPSASSATSPCCCPPTASAATSSSPPAADAASRNASHHASGCTSVPSGCFADPVRTSAPVSASRTTTLQDCVDVSTPATSVRSPPASDVLASAATSADEVLERELVEAHEAEVAVRRGVDVELLVRAAVREQVRDGLALAERRLAELEHAGVRERLLDAAVGAVGGGLAREQAVRLHVGARGVPHADLVLGARRLVVEVARARVGGAAVREAVLEQVDREERREQVAVPEHEVLVELDRALAVEVDVEELARPQGLREAVRVVEARHLLVAGLRVEAHDVAVVELRHEAERVADGRQEDVAAGLV